MEIGKSNSCKGCSSTIHETSKTRLRPLHTFGFSMISIAYSIYTISQSCLHGPIGSLTRTLAKISSPVVYTMLYQWLAMLSYLDDQILAVENLVETIFPFCSYLFDEIDTFIYMLETVPAKFCCETDHDEKEITIDVNFSEEVVKGCSAERSPVEAKLMVKPQGRDEAMKKLAVSHNKEYRSIKKQSSSGKLKHVDEKPQVEVKNEAVKEDAVLQLFAEAWYM